MKNFLVLYYSTPQAMEAFMALPEEEKQAGTAAWDIWKQNNSDTVTDLGAPLMATASVGKLETESMPTQIISGYSIIQAETVEKAKAIFKDHPYKDHGIHIFESVNM